MKKFILLAVMAIAGLQAQAQIVSSRSSMVTRESTPKAGWSTFGIEYIPGSLSADKGSEKKSQSFNGFGFEWTKASELTDQIPLFLEFGVGAQYISFSEDFSLAGYNFEQTGKMASVKIPVNLVFAFQVPNTEISVDPYVGIYGRINAWGEMTLKSDVPGYSVDESYNIFDKDDMGDEDYTFGRFQLGWKIGVKVRFANSLFVGASYGSDFSNIVKYSSFLDSKAEDISYVEKVTLKQATLSVGFVF